MSTISPILEVAGLTKHFPILRGLLSRTVGHVQAVDGVSFTLQAGETLCIVGESGCGKSTVGRCILRLIEPSAGTVKLDGVDITGLDENGMRPYRQRMQIVFQDPYASLNPRLRAGEIVGEPLENFGLAHGAERRDKVARLLERVGLRAEAMDRFPFEFSGGQRQRLGLARALAPSPRVIVADEPVSALDVSVQAQVLNLMIDLQEEFGVAYLFISHDLGVVEHIADRVAVMYLGQIVELADKTALFETPLHPYTEALLAAAPIADPGARRERLILEGDVPSPINPPAGCRFHTRCPYAVARCRVDTPALREVAPRHWTACHLREPGAAPGPLKRPG